MQSTQSIGSMLIYTFLPRYQSYSLSVAPLSRSFDTLGLMLHWMGLFIGIHSSTPNLTFVLSLQAGNYHFNLLHYLFPAHSFRYFSLSSFSHHKSKVYGDLTLYLLQSCHRSLIHTLAFPIQARSCTHSCKISPSAC